jgi:dihydrofolate reductase
MRKVVVYELLSLDGVAEDPDEFFADWDGAMDENLAAVIATQDAVILGRRSYDEWARFWPSSDIEPFATFINNVQKHIATSRPLDVEWTKADRIDGDLSSFVTELKQQPGGDIGVHGSISIAQQLLEAALVDQIRLVVAPALEFSGGKLFERGAPSRLVLDRTVTSPAGYLLLDFSVQR